MVRVLTTQASHTYGVLDPLVIERRDTKFVAASLADALNVVMLPQGGYIDRGGSTRKSLLRRKLEAVTLTTGMMTAPNAGTVANLNDGNTATLFTTNAIGTSPFVILSIDLGSVQPLCAVDLVNYRSLTDDRDNCVSVQYQVGASWFNITNPFHLRTTASSAPGSRNRRFATAPHVGNITARYLRVVVTGGSGPGQFRMDEVRIWRESATISDAVTRSFNYRIDASYQMVFTDGNLDIFFEGAWQTAVASPWTEAQIRAVKPEFDYDTAVLFHSDVQTRKLVRQGSDREWQLEPVTFENIPRADYGEVYVNGENAVQRVTYYGFDQDADAYQMILNGQKTDEIVRGSSWSVAATNLRNGLLGLSGIDSGLTASSPTNGQVLVTFAGGKNANKPWPEMVPVVAASGAYITVGTVTRGEEAGEDIISATRGWPACGRFVQERTIMGGPPQRPNTFLATVVGEVFDLDTKLGGAASALVYDLSGANNRIRDFFVGRTVLIFTDDGLWHLASAKLSAEEAPELRRSDAPGIDPNLSPVGLGNAIYYVQRGGQSLTQITYSELEQNFLGDNASVLSAFLVDSPKDIAIRRATRSNDADLLLYINQDGRLVTLTLMRSQDVSGFAPHSTEGEFVSLCTGADQTVWLVCKRNVAGAERMVLERMDPDDFLDSATPFDLGTPGTVIPGLSGYEGQDVYVFADGKHQGIFNVAGGTVVLPRAVTSGRVGFWTAPRATDTPFQPDEEAQRPLARIRRVFGVTLSVLDTAAVSVSANGGELYAHVLNEPFTGTIELEGFPGFTRDAQVTISQSVPGRLKVRSVKKKIAA